MTQKVKRKIFNEVKNNYFISYKLLIENWEPFAKTELFTLASIATVVILIKIFSLIFQFSLLVVTTTTTFKTVNVAINLTIYFNLVIILNLFLLTFLTSQFGLANDIFISGHMYAEFSSSFTYYRRHKFSYAFLTLIIYWSEFLADPLLFLPLVVLYEKSMIIPISLTQVPSFLSQINFVLLLIRQLLVDFVQILTIILIVGILPSLTKTNNLKLAIKENFDIFKKNKFLISITWLVYFIIFILPETLINVLILIVMKYYFSNVSLFIIGFLLLLVNIIFLFISMPIMSLLATRIYISLINDKKTEN